MASCKIHSPQGVVVNLNSFCHVLIVTNFSVGGGAGQEGAFAGVVVLVDQVVTSAKGDQVRVIRGRRNRHRARAAHVGVA